MSIKNLIQLDGQHLHSLKVDSKFGYTFKCIYAFLGVALCLLLVSIVVGIFGYHKLYNNFYKQNTYQGLLRIHNQNLGKAAWRHIRLRVCVR